MACRFFHASLTRRGRRSPAPKCCWCFKSKGSSHVESHSRRRPAFCLRSGTVGARPAWPGVTDPDRERSLLMHCARNRTPRRCSTRFLKISSAQDQPPQVAAFSRLKISRKWPSKQFSTVIRAGGLVALPPGLIGWRPGQRVFFAILSNQLVISARPSRVQNGRLLSTRVRAVRCPVRWQRHPLRCSASQASDMVRSQDRTPLLRFRPRSTA